MRHNYLNIYIFGHEGGIFSLICNNVISLLFQYKVILNDERKLAILVSDIVKISHNDSPMYTSCALISTYYC